MAQRIRAKAREIVTTAVLILGVLAFRSSIAEPYQVPSGSMEPTILVGDRLFVMKAAYDLKLPFTDITLAHFHEPERGDVIVFKYPSDPSVNFIKRLVGLPGDEIEVVDGNLTVNGREVPISPAQTGQSVKLWPATFYEENLGAKPHLVQRLPHHPPSEALKIKVPADSYFFMGDNRDNSNDSRTWGFVPKSYLKGKAVVVWLSLDPTTGVLPSPRWERVGTPL